MPRATGETSAPQGGVGWSGATRACRKDRPVETGRGGLRLFCLVGLLCGTSVAEGPGTREALGESVRVGIRSDGPQLELLAAELRAVGIQVDKHSTVGEATTSLLSRGGGSLGDDSKAPRWDALWDFEPQAMLPLSALPRHCILNHIPGLDVLTSKPRLAALADQHSFPFVPHTALDETTLHSLWGLDSSGVGPSSLISKAPTHRQVQVVEGDSHADILQSATTLLRQGQVIQERVQHPLLMDNRSFDLGVYVFVYTKQQGHLQAYIFDDILLRFCTLPHGTQRKKERNPSTESIIVGSKYTSMWEVPALRNAGLGRPGSSARSSLDRYLNDRALRPWLVEVNTSPNLRPSAVALRHGGAPFRALCSSIATWLLEETLFLRHANYAASNRNCTANKPAPNGFSWSIHIPSAGYHTVQPHHRLPTMRALAEHADEDCEVSEWSPYGSCTVDGVETCGITGTRYRTRDVVKSKHRNGASCPALFESQACMIECLPPSPPLTPLAPQPPPHPRLPPPLPSHPPPSFPKTPFPPPLVPSGPPKQPSGLNSIEIGFIASTATLVVIANGIIVYCVYRHGISRQHKSGTSTAVENEECPVVNDEWQGVWDGYLPKSTSTKKPVHPPTARSSDVAPCAYVYPGWTSSNHLVRAHGAYPGLAQHRPAGSAIPNRLARVASTKMSPHGFDASSPPRLQQLKALSSGGFKHSTQNHNYASTPPELLGLVPGPDFLHRQRERGRDSLDENIEKFDFSMIPNLPPAAQQHHRLQQLPTMPSHLLLEPGGDDGDASSDDSGDVGLQIGTVDDAAL